MPPHPTSLAPQIGTWTPKGSQSSTGSYRRAWGITVRRGDPAYIWAQWIAPVYSISVANIRGALRQQVGAKTRPRFACLLAPARPRLPHPCTRGQRIRLPPPPGAAMLQASGAVQAGASLDGVLERDLQLPEGARHAHVLRPLPARARRLTVWIAGLRRNLLGVTPLSRGQLL